MKTKPTKTTKTQYIILKVFNKNNFIRIYPAYPKTSHLNSVLTSFNKASTIMFLEDYQFR